MIEIGDPRPEDLPTLVGLLPMAFPTTGDPAEIIVARHNGTLAGAVAIEWSSGGFPVMVAVRPDFERQGVGRALIEAAIRAARGETSHLKSWDLIEEESGAAGFALACGFTVTRRLRYFSAKRGSFYGTIDNLRTRMARRIPAAARIVSANAAPRGALIALLADMFGIPPHSAAQRLDFGAPGAYDPELSLAALDGDRLVGAMLCRRLGDAIDIEVNMVAPDHRNAWPNVLLLAEIARRGLTTGAQQWLFGGEERITDTMNLARRTRADRLPDRLSLSLPLNGSIAR